MRCGAIQVPRPQHDPPPQPRVSARSSQRVAPAHHRSVAHLAVEDVQGLALQYIPLDISAESSGPDEKIAIRLSGLPDDAMLTSGRKLGDGTWLVADGQEQAVKLVLP